GDHRDLHSFPTRRSSDLLVTSEHNHFRVRIEQLPAPQRVSLDHIDVPSKRLGRCEQRQHSGASGSINSYSRLCPLPLASKGHPILDSAISPDFLAHTNPATGKTSAAAALA